MLMPSEHAQYVLEFIEAYRAHPDSALSRELACQRVRLGYALEDVRDGEVFAGRLRSLAVGFSPQEAGMMDYFLDRTLYNALCASVDEATRGRLEAARIFWEEEITIRKVRESYPPEVAAVLDNDECFSSAGVGFPLYRVGGLQPDYGKLVRLGLPGLRGLLEEKLKYAGGEAGALYEGLIETLSQMEWVLRRYAAQAKAKNLTGLYETLEALTHSAPRSLREGLQLVHLYAVLSGALNYGRLDETLGGLVGEDEEEALHLLLEFYRVTNERRCTTDARVIVGGAGRRNEEAADRFALLAIRASRIFHEPLPQLTLRFYDGQNPALMRAAYDNFEQGWIYPMLYRDEVNIPAVMHAFRLDGETAEQYVPFGCGEYVINHQSMGTPSGVINLLKALEVTLFDGYDLTDGRRMGLPANCDTFEGLFEAYRRNVERYVDALALQEKIEYEVAARTAPHLLLTLLYDDCVERGKPLLSGGVRYLGGTLETYGNINTSDSLTAIRKMVYEEKRFSLEQLREMLRHNFTGHERERRMLLSCPKYGNDDGTADEMAARVHEHVCNYVRGCAEKVGLHSYLVVVINNSANTAFGRYTGASADGRLAGEPMANANNPAGGMDKSGITAMLNSLVKLDNTLHAGAVQNMKFTKEMFTRYRAQTEALLRVYFQKGQQAMLNILDRGALEDAMARPELYPNLIVRVGGFAARFIELERKVQEEIVSRTLYGHDL